MNAADPQWRILSDLVSEVQKRQEDLDGRPNDQRQKQIRLRDESDGVELALRCEVAAAGG
ncbi:hypothetical protein AWN90_17150 [Nocardia terpenica]|uniref:Uncharacterized protein n=1 Tax=Nocardia terpenica TaxID=455432 RepID=A0A164PT08_9NOCA|nr:hypothetical protein AWN90_17150 [Nocardia terpenica]